MRTQLKKEKKRKLFPVLFWHFDESSVFSYVLETPLLVIMTSEEEVGRAGEAGWVGRCSAGRRSPSPSPHEHSWGRLSRWVDYDGNQHCLSGRQTGADKENCWKGLCKGYIAQRCLVSCPNPRPRHPGSSLHHVVRSFFPMLR